MAHKATIVAGLKDDQPHWDWLRPNSYGAVNMDNKGNLIQPCRVVVRRRLLALVREDNDGTARISPANFVPAAAVIRRG